MRGAGRVGGKTGNVPTPQRSPNRDLDPFDLDIGIGDLPVAPSLIPINDEWSISDPFESVDPRDCSKFPASPYCGEIPIRFPGPPVGFNIEIRRNGCTTCIYTYPVVGWLMLTPTIICKRDPNCEEDRETPPPARNSRIPSPNKRLSAGDASPECVEKINAIYDRIDAYNAGQKFQERIFNFNETFPLSILFPDEEIKDTTVDITEVGTIITTGVAGVIFGVIRGGYYQTEEGLVWDSEKTTAVSTAIIGYSWKTFVRGGKCAGRTNPPPPPPPINEDEEDRDRKKRKRGGNDMCCNECRDASDKTDRLIKEIREIKKALGDGQLEKSLSSAVGIGSDVTTILNLLAKRIGTSRYPVEVPQSLLTGVGDNVLKVDSLTDFHYWFINQIDALVGEFPIEIEVKDIDPLKEGDQKKKISLPNIAEAIAETYGLTIKNSVNQELELNMLLRLAAEIIATKNGVIVAQDYARANATFLGYKGNYKARETVYNFDFASVNLDPKSNQPIIMEKLLKTNKGYVQGWENEDKETAASFFQKLMFAAGIIKAVFFRGKSLTKQLSKEASSMADDAKTSEKDWEKFLRQINNENSMYNAGFAEKPDIKEEPKDPRNP